MLLASKPFNYSVSFNLSDYSGEVLKYSNPKGLIDDWYVGKEMGVIWGYTTDHIMVDPAEAKEMGEKGRLLAEKLYNLDYFAREVAEELLMMGKSIVR